MTYIYSVLLYLNILLLPCISPTFLSLNVSSMFPVDPVCLATPLSSSSFSLSPRLTL